MNNVLLFPQHLVLGGVPMTEYHVNAEIRGPEAELVKATGVVLTATPPRWQVLGIHLVLQRDAQRVTLEFYSRRYPTDLELFSALFPDLTLVCRLRETGDHGPDYAGERKTLQGGDVIAEEGQ
jgi:hypothetical protein